MIGMAFYGILNNYSDVPWSDLWHNNIVLLHSLFVDKDFSEFLLYKAVNHPILFTKFTYIIDHLFFNDKFIAPLFVNFISPFFILLLIFKTSKSQNFLLFFLLLGFSYTWIHSQNFTWANQTQIWFNLLFSILTISNLSVGITNKNDRYLLISIFYSFCAALTFANGLIAPALLFLTFIFYKKYSFAVISLSIAVFIFYFYHLDSGSQAPQFNLLLDYIQMAMILNGNLFYRIFNDSYPLAYLASCLYVFLTLNFIFKNLKKRKSTYLLFFIFFNIFYFLTIILIVLNRWHMDGLYLMTSARYITFSLFAWIILIGAYIELFNKFLNNKIILFLLILLLIHLLGLQLKSFSPSSKKLNRDAAILSLNLKVGDMDQIYHLTKEASVFNDSRRLIDSKFGLFGNDALVKMRNYEPLFSEYVISESACNLDISRFSKVNNEFFLVKGTFGSVSPQSKYISFLNLHSRNPIGYGVVSPNDNIFKKDRKYNFIGYIKFDDYKKLIFNSHECKVEFQVPLSN